MITAFNANNACVLLNKHDQRNLFGGTNGTGTGTGTEVEPTHSGGGTTNKHGDPIPKQRIPEPDPDI